MCDMVIDAKGVYYKELNKRIRDAILRGKKTIDLININGQRYIADGINSGTVININGVPGQDLAAFMNGPTVIVNSNAQDGVGNTMNNGKVIIHGMAGDVLGYGMRGGKLHILGDVGYRVGIHMKSYKDQVPVIIVGGKAGDFFGEYMAGGVLILLNLNKDDPRPAVGDYFGTGMHGGAIYVRGVVDKHKLGAEVNIREIEEDDERILEECLKEYCDDLKLDYEDIMSVKFTKYIPVSRRPYGNLYAY